MTGVEANDPAALLDRVLEILVHYLKHLAGLGVTDIHPGGAAASRCLIRALAVEPGQRLLELGCGAGNTSRRLARLPGVEVIGIDLLHEMLMAANQRLRFLRRTCALLCAKSSKLPFFDGCFDRVLAESVIGFQDSRCIGQILREAFRVLRPGGMMVANEAIWRAKADPAVTASINRQALADFGLRPASEDSWSIDRWLDEIRSAGFQVLSSAELAPPDRIDHLQARLRRYLWSIRALRSTAQRAAERDYRRRLNAQRWPEAAIEARLFVLVKPA